MNSDIAIFHEGEVYLDFEKVLKLELAEQSADSQGRKTLITYFEKVFKPSQFLKMAKETNLPTAEVKLTAAQAQKNLIAELNAYRSQCASTGREMFPSPQGKSEKDAQIKAVGDFIAHLIDTDLPIEGKAKQLMSSDKGLQEILEKYKNIFPPE